MTDWRAGLLEDEGEVDPRWREHLDAARRRTTPGQDTWDRDFNRRRRAALRDGNGQRAAIEIAWTRTEDQQGPRPTNEEAK